MHRSPASRRLAPVTGALAVAPAGGEDQALRRRHVDGLRAGRVAVEAFDAVEGAGGAGRRGGGDVRHRQRVSCAADFTLALNRGSERGVEVDRTY